ncbi:hypothetical protein INT47_002767 [Mucor saturninus]|uniref:Uncharacterized protein n=1 Tax=Mucor saturninus TaxID=64648 RepID=A0A8H7QJV2_9FUNG|nr:hypothetical protein INT47_002767 [Mucor saturninus]
MNNQNNASNPIDGQPESSQHGIVERGRGRGRENGRGRGGRNGLGRGNQSGGQNEDDQEGSQRFRGAGWGQAETLLLIENKFPAKNVVRAPRPDQQLKSKWSNLLQEFKRNYAIRNSTGKATPAPSIITRVEDVPEDVPEDGVNLEPEVPLTVDDVRPEDFFAVGEQEQPRTARRRLETHRVSTAAAFSPATTTTQHHQHHQHHQHAHRSPFNLPSMLRVLDRVQQTRALKRDIHCQSFLQYSRETNAALLTRSDRLAELFAESNRETTRFVDAILQDMANRNQQGQNKNNSDQ